MKGRYPERRQHVRIVTLRNFAWLTLASVLILAAINVMSELRAPHANDYGRILDKQIIASPDSATTQTAAVTPVEEGASVGSENLVDNPAPVTPVQAAPAPPPQLTTSPTPIAADANGTGKIAIIGDESGVAIVSPKHKLRGGWFRP